MSNECTLPEGGLYLIRLSDRHFYGGRAKNFARRWDQHLRALEGGRHSNRHMQNVYNKYKRFEPEVLQTLSSRSERVAAEKAWLDANHGRPGCVNASPHSTGGNIVVWDTETRQRHSEILRGHSHSETTRAKMARTRKSNPNLIEKARAALAKNRKKFTPEEMVEKARRMSENNRGRKQSSETIAKRAAKHLGRKNTPETIEKMRESALKRAQAKPTSHGEETRALISSQQKGRVWINNGVENRRVFPEQAPEGWKPGRK